jgi:hypothetical protein
MEECLARAGTGRNDVRRVCMAQGVGFVWTIEP